MAIFTPERAVGIMLGAAVLGMGYYKIKDAFEDANTIFSSRDDAQQSTSECRPLDTIVISKQKNACYTIA